MLYVFQVEPGLMTEYDMTLTLQSVGCLKQEIERRTKIPASSLVLLVSGGVVLQSDKTVSSYSAGTDTNPIYMFCKPSVKESHIKQSMCGDLSPIAELSTGEFRSDSRSAFDAKSVQELKQAVEKCCSLPATVSTLMTCATLAQQFSNLGHELSKSCAELVHEQHLQHQGWAAVVANLEDIYTEFCERSKNFKETFKKHRQKKEEYHQLLNSLNEVLEFLGKIPILPALRLNAEAHRFSAFDVFEEVELERQYYKSGQFLDNSSEKVQQDFGVEAFKIFDEDVFDQNNASTSKGEAQCVEAVQQIVDSDEEGVTFKAHSFESKPEEPTLLHWILAKGNKASLQDILDYCQKGLTLIEEEPLRKCESELYQILEYANNRGLKQIKGIEDRLYGLDQLLKDVKKRERDQHDQAASLIQVRERFSSGSALDPSVLPTLAQSHWCQLEKLLKGHLALVDIRRRITKSKEELSRILKARLETVLVIENKMSVQDAHSMLSFQCFHRLTRYFEIVHQLHRAPHVLMRAVHEVARRRTFSHAYLKWANDIAERMSKIYSEEMSRREAFNAVFGGHFLKSLFPGLTDAPSEFATSPPSAFDARLPCLADTDARRLADNFPQLAEDVPVYDMEATVKFFGHRVYSEHEERDADVQVDFEKDFESETETGDFERLSKQSAEPKQTVNTSTICVPETATVATVTEDNMDSTRVLQNFMRLLCDLCRRNIMHVRDEIDTIKNAMDEQKRYMESVCTELMQAWEHNKEENEIKFREQTQRLTVDHELELSDMKATLNSKDDVIDALKKDNESLIIEHKKECERLENEHESTKSFLEKTKDEISALEKKIDDIEVLNQKEIKELQEKMHMDYKAEIESLRSRFRLVAVTNMDRSPSESSLEKIERTDVIEINSHNAIVMQTKENAEVEKEEAVREAVDKNDAAWTKKFNDEIEALKAQQQVSLNNATRRLLSEKDRQLELMREREQTLTRECAKYRDTIQQLTDPETNAVDSLLRTQVATLENEKALLQQQVQELKKELEKREDKSEEKSREDDSEGRSSQKEDGGRRSCNRCHTPIGLPAGTLTLSSCLPGHTVFIMWDPTHLNYTVMQEATIMYFVHSDCLPALDLSIQVQNESDRRLYAVATVESKEFCYAKRSGNRYRMPRGSRFYRVRVRPAGGAARIFDQPLCCDHKHKPDMLKLVDASQSTSSTKEEVGAAKVSEVVTATLINLESPVSTSEAASTSSAPLLEEQPDSIEASEQWNTSRMQISTASVMTDMECSVARCAEGTEPLEVRGSSVPRGAGPDELAQEAAP